ncbi:hypothetical protein E3P81_01585 [Wallemia ichthyophaga]|nr:hypothetical protein E3P97_01586 [Wallemia ichthyophaga]TIB33702.1 hypothetical protein E3P85_01238 [Wallemia ichthyophaga]TIB47732.1 hypothetical protein E3P82_01584 [Wallemia ichthyophaga]TIB52076.1 hypothetical protein E3P81_01585 [Wallemia ichthyophaga]TIB54884.1 hypothetical protein E3P80_01585 [Wallemia ichthyophaga]
MQESGEREEKYGFDENDTQNMQDTKDTQDTLDTLDTQDTLDSNDTQSLTHQHKQEHQHTLEPPLSPSLSLLQTKSLDKWDDAEEDFIKMEDHTTGGVGENENGNENEQDAEDIPPAKTVDEFDKRMSVLGLRTPPESERDIEHAEKAEHTEHDLEKILSELAKVREDNVALMTSNEKYKEDCELIAQELEIEKKQRVDAEEIIVQLRTRVEESRNGVMKLQQQQEQDKSRRRQETESKRSSFILSEPANLSKRASIKSHKRLSSVSADNASISGNGNGNGNTTKSLKDLHLNPQPAPQQPSSNASSNRSSQVMDMTNVQMENANLSNEIQRLRREVDVIKEGKLSSENALRALREFMDSSGEEKPSGLKLPPLPTDEDVPTPTDTAHKTNASWLFGRQQSSARNADGTTPTLTQQSHSQLNSHAHSHAPSNDGGFDKPSTLRSISSFFGKS